jgi:hypothetical protein
MPRLIPKPSRTEEVLAAVAARCVAGATVTQSAIAEACGVSEGTAPRFAGGRGRWAAGRIWTVSGGPAQSGQADRPATADGFRLVVDAGRR